MICRRSSSSHRRPLDAFSSFSNACRNFLDTSFKSEASRSALSRRLPCSEHLDSASLSCSTSSDSLCHACVTCHTGVRIVGGIGRRAAGQAARSRPQKGYYYCCIINVLSSTRLSRSPGGGSCRRPHRHCKNTNTKVCVRGGGGVELMITHAIVVDQSPTSNPNNTGTGRSGIRRLFFACHPMWPFHY